MCNVLKSHSLELSLDHKEGNVAELIHTSRIRLEKIKGSLRHAYVENFKAPIRFGIHGGIKRFYGIEPDEELPATLDHLIAAVGG